MAIRFDNGEILNPYLTDDGILLCDAVFARDGVLEYKQRDGTTRREFRPPEENQKAIAEFGLASVTLEHPRGLVDKTNGDSLRKGISLQAPRYVTVPGKGGFVQGQIAVTSADAQAAVRRGDASEISAGYKCRIDESPGAWVNPATGETERYDAIQRDIKVNHIALTRLGRAGPSVKVLGRFDSADLEDGDLAYQVNVEPPNSLTVDSPTEETMTTNGYAPNMATLNLPGGSVQVPQDIFNTIQPLLTRNDSAIADLRSDLEDAEERADSAEASLEDVTSQVEYQKGTIEALKDRLDAAEAALEEFDVSWRGDSYRLDGKGKKKGKMPPFMRDLEDEEDEENMDAMDEEYSEDMDDMDEEEMDDMPMKKRKGKKDMGYGKKKDMKSKKDSINPLAEMWKVTREAEALGVDISELKLDSLEDADDIRRFVVEQKRPHLNLDDASDPYVRGLYDAIAEDGLGEPARTDSESRTDYADELGAVLGITQSRSGSRDAAAEADRQRRMNNYSTPLSSNKDNIRRR